VLTVNSSPEMQGIAYFSVRVSYQSGRLEPRGADEALVGRRIADFSGASTIAKRGWESSPQ
jgi:hypothetical protein